LFLDRGRAYARSDAFAALLGRLPAPWRAFRGLRHLPRPLRDGLYGVVARNRYRLFGRRDDCMMPSPEVRARFLLDPPQGT
ncbi:thiol-disulfide oxidoreductase DCC family protein, partial [Stenotrophomonas maltophilia]